MALKKKPYGIGNIVSWGATIVIIGLMLKILHVPGGTYFIAAGLTAEAILFFILGFQRETEEPDWTKAYPELADDYKGEPVRKVQEGLMDLGYQLPKFGADSDFGNETKQAVLEFQSDNKLTYDGVVGVQTMGRLDDIKAGNLRGNPCGEGTALPQLGRTFNIDDQKTLDGTFCSKGDFSITATAKWAGPHPNNEKHYHIVIHPENGKVNSPTRRFDVNGKPENQPFKVTTKDDRLFFKVTVMVINNSKKNPKLSGTISIF